MAYINGKKIIQAVKTAPQFYKHHVKMQGSYQNVDYTVYADFISKDNTSWVGKTFDQIDQFIQNGYEGIIAGYDSLTYRFQYALINNGTPPSFQCELYYKIYDWNGFKTIDASVLSFITDTVTPLI